MTFRLLQALGTALLCACSAVMPSAADAAVPACAATARHAPQDPRILQAIEEARRQHQLFGGQTVERNGGIFHIGYHEAEWDRRPGESTPAWERVATFWRALSELEPPALMTSVGRVRRSQAASAVPNGSPTSREEVAIREALLRASIVDTPWSAAFISYLMKTAGFSRSEFEFSDSHADYVQAALDVSAAEAAGQDSTQAFRACDIATTPVRAGDLICATRASTAGTAKFAALVAAMAARSRGEAFPMHCDLVVRSDAGGDAKLESVGGNVVNSVTLSRMTLNARRVLSDGYITGAVPQAHCVRVGAACRESLSRRPWVVVLQFRN